MCKNNILCSKHTTIHFVNSIQFNLTRRTNGFVCMSHQRMFFFCCEQVRAQALQVQGLAESPQKDSLAHYCIVAIQAGPNCVTDGKTSSGLRLQLPLRPSPPGCITVKNKGWYIDSNCLEMAVASSQRDYPYSETQQASHFRVQRIELAYAPH